jgi:hypothetical protein
MTQRKKQAQALCGTAGVGDRHRRKDTQDNVGKVPRGLVATCKDSSNEAKAEGEESHAGLTHESVGAKTEE